MHLLTIHWDPAHNMFISKLTVVRISEFYHKIKTKNNKQTWDILWQDNMNMHQKTKQQKKCFIYCPLQIFNMLRKFLMDVTDVTNHKMFAGQQKVKMNIDKHKPID